MVPDGGRGRTVRFIKVPYYSGYPTPVKGTPLETIVAFAQVARVIIIPPIIIGFLAGHYMAQIVDNGIYDGILSSHGTIA